MGCNASSAAKGPKGGKIQLYAVTASANCMGAAMLLADNGILDLVPTMPGEATKKEEYLKINPFGAVPAMKDGNFCLAESMAILRYIATAYVTAAYPTDEKTRAHIDWAGDRFGSALYADAVATIYPAMGFGSPPSDKEAVAKKCMENLESFCQKFLMTKFVGGNVPSIADYRIAPFFFLYEHPALQEKAGVTCPDRIKSFNKDFSTASKSYNMLIAADGFAEKEILEKASEVKGEVPAGTGFTPSGTVTLPKDIATTGKNIEVYGVPVSGNAVGAIMFAQYAGVGDMKQCMPGQDTMTEEFLKMNPFHGIPTVKDGEYCVAESTVTLRYLASKYHPAAYPVDPQKRAMIDWAMDRFATAMYSDVVKLLYPILGFGPEPEDKPAVAEAAKKRIEQFADVFLKEKFIGGSQVSIADFKVVPSFFMYCHEGVEKLSGVVCPDRIKKFVKDFEEAVKPATLLSSAGGFSIKEFTESKIAEKN